MTPPFPPPPPHYVIPPRLWSWLAAPWTVAVLLWIGVVAAAGTIGYRAYTWFDNAPLAPPERQRADGNGGHAQIDFGGQWLMGRMLVTGHGRELYHRQRQWQVLREGYPESAEAPLQRGGPRPERFLATGTGTNERFAHDADNLMGWFMGEADPVDEWKRVGSATSAPLAVFPTNPLAQAAIGAHAEQQITPELAAKVQKPSIGGPLYPPVHALFYAPLGLIESPQRAYRVFQAFSLFVVLMNGLGIKLLTRGRIWWPVAALCLLVFPGTRGGVDLGQNPALSLGIIIWGWVLASRGYPVAGGMVWGLFAFKPVWGMAFFLVPLLMRQWRFCAAMVLTGAAFGALTLPFVGLESWFEWLKVGQEAAELYKVNDNWIHLSRDLHGIPRRMLHDFTAPEKERDKPLTNALAWGLWAVVFGGTALIYLVRGDRTRMTGLSAGLLFLGAYLTCYRFMYYDVLLSAAALAVLFADPRRFFRTPTFALAPGPSAAPLPTARALPAPGDAR
ncbi:MAG TPA: glycosyltransferase family 87 protein, partial [Gemmata sp.]